jgi:hypothetical protein
MKYEFSKIVAQEKVNSKSMHDNSKENPFENRGSDSPGAPWYKALKPIDAINEVPELVEVEEDFNEDQQKQYRSQSNYNEAVSPANKNNNYDGFSYRKVSEIGTNSIVPNNSDMKCLAQCCDDDGEKKKSNSYLDVFKNSRELVDNNRSSMLFKNNKRTSDAAAGLESRRSRMGSQLIKIPQRISSDEPTGLTPNESPFRNIDESPEFGKTAVPRRNSSFKIECELNEEEQDHANTTSHYILTTNQNSKGTLGK